MKFKKADHLRGGVLTLHIGGGDRRVQDDDILEGREFEKFVGHGMLVRIQETATVEPEKEVVVNTDDDSKNEDVTPDETKSDVTPDEKEADDVPAVHETTKEAVSKSDKAADAMAGVVKASGSKRGRRTKK